MSKQKIGDHLEVLQNIVAKVEELGAEALTDRDSKSVALAWEGMGGQRMLFLMMWLRRLAQGLEASESEGRQEAIIQNAIDFAFRYFGLRFIGLFFDGLGLLFRHNSTDQLQCLALAKESPYATRTRLNAAVLGMSGTHYYYEERYQELQKEQLNEESRDG